MSTQLQVGSIVRVRDEVSPRYGWGGVQRGEHGRIVLIEDDGDARIESWIVRWNDGCVMGFISDE